MHRLVIVDEAYHENTFEKGVNGKHLLLLIDKWFEKNTRFVFFDSHFYERNKKAIDFMSDISSRCEEYSFDGILDRPMDIPLLVASAVINSPQMKKYQSIRIAGKILLSATSQIIEDGNPRRAINYIKKACERAEERSDGSLLCCDYENIDEKISSYTDLIEGYYVVLH